MTSLALRQVLLNLLSNAVKFTESGEVVLSVRGQRRDANRYQLQFAVRDTGLGIPPDRLDRLFRPFSQLDASTTRRFGGTGLGLIISKRLVELMGGTMWVESTGIPGQGSTFYLTILAEVAPDQRPARQEPEEMDLAGKRVLIVDDNETNRQILVHYAESWRMGPTAVASGREALALVRQGEPFDVAILDLQMPDMDGMSLAKEITERQSQGVPTDPALVARLPGLGRRRVPVCRLSDQADQTFDLAGYAEGGDIQTSRVGEEEVQCAGLHRTTGNWAGVTRCASCWPRTMR